MEIREVCAGDDDPATRRAMDPTEQPDERRLPRPVLTHDRDDGARLELDRDVVNRVFCGALVSEGDVLQRDALRERCGWWQRPTLLVLVDVTPEPAQVPHRLDDPEEVAGAAEDASDLVM